MAIHSVASLRRHLQWAMEVELTLIQPYLYAMWSIRDQASAAARLIRSVVVEEMLHAALDANMLTAIGGTPSFYRKDLPTYPRPLPHHVPELMIDLAPASKRVIDLFVVIEQPTTVKHIPEGDVYETQGQFYMAIEEAFERLNNSEDLFAEPRVERQLGDAAWYAPVEYDVEESGGLMAITGIETVRDAISTVIHQGEGLSDVKWADPGHRELTHYEKFLEIRDGHRPLGAVWPATINPRSEDLPKELRPVAALFNASYCYLLTVMDGMYEPMERTARQDFVGRLYGLMNGVLGPLARYLVAQPIDDGLNAGPPFEYYEFGDEPQQEVRELAARVAAVHTDLGSVASALAEL